MMKKINWNALQGRVKLTATTRPEPDSTTFEEFTFTCVVGSGLSAFKDIYASASAGDKWQNL